MREGSKPIDTCPIQGVIDIISKKWGLLIVAVLGNSPSMRYNDIMRELKGISPKTLADTLKALLDTRIIVRKAFNEIPPRVEYALTDDGKKLRNAIRPLIQWAVDHSGNRECIILKSVIERKKT